MARQYVRDNFQQQLEQRRYNVVVMAKAACIASFITAFSPLSAQLSPTAFLLFYGLIPAGVLCLAGYTQSYHRWLETERSEESARRGGKPVLGMPPQRNAMEQALVDARDAGKIMLDRYLVGFELDSGDPIWVTDDELCTHGCVFAKTGVGKTLWLEGLMFQQLARGRASGFTFIDAKRDPGTLADIIMMALITGRIEDLVVVDPFDPVCAYNFVFTTQRADVKARKVLRCGLPPTSDASTTKHYDRLAADAVYRVVRAMESLGLAWSVADVAVALSAFQVAYPRMRELLHEQGAKQAMVELGHLASSYRTGKGGLDAARLTDNLRGIASELHSIANCEAGEMFCTPRAELSLTDAILRGKMVYYMLPRLEEAEAAARMVKVFREDLEVSIGEITSSRTHRLEDPHLVIIDEGASTFGPTWANLFELARKGRFALLFGAQSVGGLMDETMGLSEQFYERVIANVNLKVIMRIGDNRTAEDMSEWIGMVATTKKSLATGISSALNSRELTKHIEFNKRAAEGFREGITVSEDEEALVSPEELKHEMSAEKGLAWFDKGDGRLRKGRAIWFEADLPSTWEGREFLTRYESIEADEVGLAEWVDEHILAIEREESERSMTKLQATMGPEGAASSSNYSENNSPNRDSAERPADNNNSGEESPYRFNLLKGFRGKVRANTFMGAIPEKAPEKEAPAPTETKSEKAATPPPAPESRSAEVERKAEPAKESPASNGSAAPSAGNAEKQPLRLGGRPGGGVVHVLPANKPAAQNAAPGSPASQNGSAQTTVGNSSEKTTASNEKSEGEQNSQRADNRKPPMNNGKQGGENRPRDEKPKPQAQKQTPKEGNGTNPQQGSSNGEKFRFQSRQPQRPPQKPPAGPKN